MARGMPDRSVGEAKSGRLPLRVEQAIAVEQDRGERLIGWFQLGIVVFFSALYALSRPAEGQMLDASHWLFSLRLPGAVQWLVLQVVGSPVPLALGLYFVATVIRLVWSHRRRLPHWSLIGSILIDITLLMGLIWSFHIQYGQPPAFYLKSPTVLYVFIFIGLRALRFEERYVLITGVVAATGWLVLVVYAALWDPDGMPATRNYVEYMTSPKILFGAEIDKVVTILVVSGLLGLAIRNARRILVRAVVEGEAAHDLKRFFSPAIAERITGAEERIEAGEGRICEAAALFVDLRGFTAIARNLDPNETVRMLAEYQSLMVPLIQKHGGAIDKFLGDGIMASFGCAQPSETYARDALAAADELIAAARAWSAGRRAAGVPATRAGIGVASGPVLFGAVGDASRLEYTVIGDAVNLAAKLEKQTKREGVQALTDLPTFRLAQRQGYAATKPVRPAVPVEGVGEPLDLVVIA